MGVLAASWESMDLNKVNKLNLNKDLSPASV